MHDRQKIFPVITSGFTLIEVVAVLVLIAILAAVAIPKYIDMRETASRRTAQVVTSALNASLHLLYAQNIAAGATGAAYNMANIVDHAKIDPALHFVLAGNTCSTSIGGITFSWTLNPAPDLPDETGAIQETAGW